MIELDVNASDARDRLLAHLEGGEEVRLTRDGVVVAIARPVDAATKTKRVLGVWDHLGLDLPEDLFIGPDADTLAGVDGPLFPGDDEAAV